MSLVQGAKGLSGTEAASRLWPLSSGLLEKASQRSAPCLSIIVNRDLMVGWEPNRLPVSTTGCSLWSPQQCPDAGNREDAGRVLRPVPWLEGGVAIRSPKAFFSFQMWSTISLG